MLEELYEKNDVPKGDQILLAKNTALVVPAKDFDVEPWLKHLGLSKYEVSIIWPKDTVNMLAEICAVRAKLVLQAGRRFFKKFPYAVRPEDASAFKEDAVRYSPDRYVTLHHHDEYSIRDALGTVKQLMKLLEKQRRSFCCVTNHGSVGGWIRQYKACRDVGIKPIFGMESYYSDYRGDDPEIRKLHRSANHIILLAKTREGFDNIIRIHNDAQIEGFYYSPRANREAFKKWGRGVVATTACMKGEIPRLLIEGEHDKAVDAYNFYASVFDEFYIELHMIEYELQREVNRLLVRFAQEVGAPMILASDSHYLEKGQDDTHNILMCIRQHKTVMEQKEADDVWEFEVGNLFYRNENQMEDIFYNGFVEKSGDKRLPFKDEVFTEEIFREAMSNTLSFARCAEDIELDSAIQLPRLSDDGKSMLTSKINKGFTQRGLHKKENADDYLARVNHEFRVITKLGWTDYFLICERIVSDAKKEFGEWVVGYGRGSAAGSLVSYCLGITDIDPLEHGLLFERFIDEDRADPPDIDNDFDPRHREAIKKHIVELFGEDNVCSIGTYQTYKTRAVILDVARTLGYDVYEANEVTKKIDPLQAFEDEEGQEQKVDDISFDELTEHYPDLKAYFEKYPDVRHHAEVLRNQIKNMGTHAGGVIISDKSLKGRIPVLYDKPAEKIKRKIVSAWAEGGSGSTKNEELTAVGLVKFDILGLKNLPVVGDCVRLIEETTGEKLHRDDVPIDDKRAIKGGSKEDLVGIFQLENPATFPVADAVGLESLADVSALTSLIRPGPRDMGMDMEYADRKGGKPYEMPEFMKKLLTETHGVITYQEQAMMVAQQLAGFGRSESYKFVKAIAKKIPTLMAEFKSKFVKGARPRVEAGDLTMEEVETIWSLLETFAGYGFNKAHAVAYSALSTAELWLKYTHPLPFICSLINNTPLGKKKHGQDVFVAYVNYARRKGFDVLSPDVSKSKACFTIEENAIRFSIGHVKNVASMASVIESFQPFKSMEDFHERAKTEVVSKKTGKKSHRRPNKGVVNSLIAANAFSAFGTRNEVSKEYYRLRKKKDEEVPQYEEHKWIELETEMIGLCLSKPPICKEYADDIKKHNLLLISHLDGSENKNIRLFCRIRDFKPHTSRAGNNMHMIDATDGIDSIKFWVFRGAWEYFRDNLKKGYIAGVSLSRFDDGDMRFFDDRRDSIILWTPSGTAPPPASEKEEEAKPAIKRRFPAGGFIEFREGAIDSWYVYFDSPHLRRITKDVEMLLLLERLDGMYGNRVYNDVVEIYDAIPSKGKDDTLPDDKVHDRIEELKQEYGNNSELAAVLLTYVYWVMVAEENKENTILGKRIKRLGIHMVLKDGVDPKEAANCSKRKSHTYLDKECGNRGF